MQKNRDREQTGKGGLNCQFPKDPGFLPSILPVQTRAGRSNQFGRGWQCERKKAEGGEREQQKSERLSEVLLADHCLSQPDLWAQGDFPPCCHALLPTNQVFSALLSTCRKNTDGYEMPQRQGELTRTLVTGAGRRGGRHDGIVCR